MALGDAGQPHVAVHTLRHWHCANVRVELRQTVCNSNKPVRTCMAYVHLRRGFPTIERDEGIKRRLSARLTSLFGPLEECQAGLRPEVQELGVDAALADRVLSDGMGEQCTRTQVHLHSQTRQHAGEC